MANEGIHREMKEKEVRQWDVVEAIGIGECRYLPGSPFRAASILMRYGQDENRAVPGDPLDISGRAISSCRFADQARLWYNRENIV